MSSVEYMLVRLTAQSSGPNPKEPGGGKPELTAADISLIAAINPHMSYHALMAKCCNDPISENRLLNWVQRISIKEWFSNKRYAEIRVQAKQLKKMSELAVLSFLNPQLPHARTIETRAAYINAAKETFRCNFNSHYGFLMGELGYLEQVGRRAILRFRYGKNGNDL